jgi:hypothetical protein
VACHYRHLKINQQKANDMIDEEITSASPSKQSPITGDYEATGLLGMGGFLFYYVGCIFAITDKHPILRFHADHMGDAFDIDFSEMVGTFTKSADKLEGKCRFELATAEEGAGGIELTIWKDDVIVGFFTGTSEGLGEAVLTGSGKLTIPATSTHDNVLTFKGISPGIKTMKFDYGDMYKITSGQPWGELTTNYDSTTKELTIDVVAGRSNSKDCAEWYSTGYTNGEMIHTRGGSTMPSELNFSIKGVLTINDTSKFNLCLGQGHDGDHDNWYLASIAMVSDSDHKNGYLGSYRLTQEDSAIFNVE